MRFMSQTRSAHAPGGHHPLVPCDRIRRPTRSAHVPGGHHPLVPYALPAPIFGDRASSLASMRTLEAQFPVHPARFDELSVCIPRMYPSLSNATPPHLQAPCDGHHNVLVVQLEHELVEHADDDGPQALPVHTAGLPNGGGLGLRRL
eukprot:scaffold138460_cov24-Tisochrysis_lutea.AAC.3